MVEQQVRIAVSLSRSAGRGEPVFAKACSKTFLTATDMKQTPAYKRVIPRPVLRALATVLVIGIIVGSFLPGSEKIRIGTQPFRPIPNHIALQHRLYHLVTFGGLALVVLMLAGDLLGEVKGAASVFALGCLIEITQYSIGFATLLEWWDVRDDLYAVAAAFILIQLASAVTETIVSRRQNSPVR